MTSTLNKMGNSTNDRGPSMDHGYAWIVTIAVFGSNLLLVGHFRSFSVFFVDMVDTFHITYTLASIIMSVQGAVGCVTALLVHSVLLDRVGARPLAMAGGLLFASGISLAYFARSALCLVLSLGVLVGLGNGAVYGPGTVLLGRYFEKRRALATSLAGMGGSVGSMVMPVIATQLILHFGLRGAFLLFGALTLNMCVTSALYRPPSDPVDLSSDCESSLLSDIPATSSSSSSPSSPSAGSQHASDCASRPDSSLLFVQDEVEIASLKDCPELWEKTTDLDSRLFMQSVNLLRNGFFCSSVDSRMDKLSHDLDVKDEGKRCLNHKGPVLRDGFDFKTKNCNGWLLPVLKIDILKEHSSLQDLADSHCKQFSVKHRRHGTLSDLTALGFSSNLLESGQPCKLSQVLHTVETASMFSSQPHLPAVSPLLSEMEIIVAAEEGRKEDGGSDDTINQEPRMRSWRILGACFSCDGLMLRNPSFWLIQVYSAVGFIGSQGALIYLPSMLQGKGIGKEEVALILTVWGSCSLLGRFLCGVTADRQILRPTTMTVLGFLGLGVLFLLVPVLPGGLGVWLAFMVLYGLLEGLYFCLMPVIIIDLLTLQHFSSAFGFTRLSQCTFVMLLFPVLGQLRDQTGDYSASFCLIGACAFLSAGLFILHSVCRALASRASTPDTSPDS